MTIRFELPDRVENDLRGELGNLSEVAREAFLIECYRTGRMSVGYLGEVLGIGVIEADRWLAERGIPLNYSLNDLDADRRTLRHLTKLRQR